MSHRRRRHLADDGNSPVEPASGTRFSVERSNRPSQCPSSGANDTATASSSGSSGSSERGSSDAYLVGFIKGLLEGCNYLTVLELLVDCPEFRRYFVKNCLLTGLILLGAFITSLLMPLFDSAILSNLVRYVQPFVLQVPVYTLLLVLSAGWYTAIYDNVAAHWRSKRTHKGRSMLSDYDMTVGASAITVEAYVGEVLYALLLVTVCFSIVIQVPNLVMLIFRLTVASTNPFIVQPVAVVAELAYCVLMCMLKSYNAFDYALTGYQLYKKKTLLWRLRFMEERWTYFLGFAAPSQAIDMFIKHYLKADVWVCMGVPMLTFPALVALTAGSDPRPTSYVVPRRVAFYSSFHAFVMPVIRFLTRRIGGTPQTGPTTAHGAHRDIDSMHHDQVDDLSPTGSRHADNDTPVSSAGYGADGSTGDNDAQTVVTTSSASSTPVTKAPPGSLFATRQSLIARHTSSHRAGAGGALKE